MEKGKNKENEEKNTILIIGYYATLSLTVKVNSGVYSFVV